MENEKLGVGADIEFKVNKEYTLTSQSRFQRYIEFDLDAVGSLLYRPSLNPKHHQVDLFLGYLVVFEKTAGGDQLGQDIELKNYGSLSVGLNAAVESNQTLTEQNLDQGAELRYINESKPLVPIVELSYLFVLPYRSDFREELDTENNMFQRFEARAFWTILLGRFLLNPDFRYFRSSDLSATLKENGLDEGFHSAVSFGYVVGERDSGPLQYIDYLYLQYNRGQFPVYLDNRETIEAGIRFGF
ncbi:MAG: hypothetical protein GVY08_13130 [Bacteroidetes bacterium]|jgi:hypothetical protein|nr:hypothetical protein [Bacteroidota bacterium]